MVMISTPMPMPAMKRHNRTPLDVVWHAITMEAAV
jgi:hypothetical protein